MKIATPSHFAATGDAVSSRPAPARAAKATTPATAQASRYPPRNKPIRAARAGPAEAPLIRRVHSTATGATDGSIIAAIITTHSPRKGSSARPIVPGPLPMSRASMTVTTHAPAASSPTAIHGTASWRGGSACTGRAAEAGSETSAMAESAFVPEIGDEAVGPGEISAPGAVIAHELIAAHRQSTRDLGMRRAVVPFNKEAHIALLAAGSGPLRGRSPIFRLVAPPPQARKPICEKIRPGTVPGNRSSIKQRAT